MVDIINPGGRSANMEGLTFKNSCDLAPGRGESGGTIPGTEDRRLGERDLPGHVDVKQVDLPGLN